MDQVAVEAARTGPGGQVGLGDITEWYVHYGQKTWGMEPTKT
jgi:hypothetical protein